MFDIYNFFNKLSELNVKIRLNVGQPDIPVDERIISALIESIKRGETTYVSTGGISELKEKIVEIHGVQPQEVIIAPGSKVLSCFSTLLREKDSCYFTLLANLHTNGQKIWKENSNHRDNI